MNQRGFSFPFVLPFVDGARVTDKKTAGGNKRQTGEQRQKAQIIVILILTSICCVVGTNNPPYSMKITSHFLPCGSYSLGSSQNMWGLPVSRLVIMASLTGGRRMVLTGPLMFWSGIGD